MGGRLIFLHRARGRPERRSAERGRPARVGRPARARALTTPKPREAEPRKASGRLSRARPYRNRHRWAGRRFSGARENAGEGTRQIGPVTSGQGAPPAVSQRRGAAGKWVWRLFIKN